MRQFSVYAVIFTYYFLWKLGAVVTLLVESDQSQIFNILTGDAVVSEDPFELKDDAKDRQTEQKLEKRSSAAVPPTLDIEETDAVWCRSPKHLTLTYNGSTEVKCGRNYKYDDIRYTFHQRPEISSKKICEKKLYTLAMLDPDAPDRKNHLARNWLHWLVVDIANANGINFGKEILGYEPPEPPPGTGEHRFVFLLLEQQGPSANRFTGGRTAFSIRRYVRENNLLDAVSGFTYFTTE